ncbi:MAG: polyprenyl synthetase family protein [Synergistaceae bacterium]|nr:polyprenyl synthetase family protein [Synergistaceae bacterium]
MHNSIVKNTMNQYRLLFEDYLSSTATKRSEGVPTKLFESMEYSLNAKGKRLRPILCLAVAERCGCKPQNALPMALGLEMLHTATLIHDDLPCMDNDDMRRGKLSNHKKFGETLAVLAGDALLAQSIEYPLLNLKKIETERIIHAMQVFTSAIGPSGVCGGQVLDMDTSNIDKIPNYVRKIAELKTGALISASVVSGAILGTDDKLIIDCYKNYGLHLGSAFQIVDDILDVTSTAKELGKTQGKDFEQEKITHVSVYGLETARKMANEESTLAKKSISKLFKLNDFLLELPDYLIYRTN